jgi:hypothetical protein
MPLTFGYKEQTYAFQYRLKEKKNQFRVDLIKPILILQTSSPANIMLLMSYLDNANV